MLLCGFVIQCPRVQYTNNHLWADSSNANSWSTSTFTYVVSTAFSSQWHRPCWICHTASCNIMYHLTDASNTNAWSVTAFAYVVSDGLQLALRDTAGTVRVGFVVQRLAVQRVTQPFTAHAFQQRLQNLRKLGPCVHWWT